MSVSQLSARVGAVVGVVALALSCSSGKADKWEYALPLGTFDVEEPVCLSTGKSPEYPAANYKAVLLDFSGLSLHTLKIDSDKTIETLQDDDCSLAIERSIFKNHDEQFVLRRDRRHTFAPEGCTLQVLWSDHVYDVSPAYGDLFVDSANRAEELPYALVPIEGGYDLVTRDDPELNKLWATFGCADPDRLSIRLRPRAN